MSWKVCEFRAMDVLVASDARPMGDGGWGFEGDIAPQAFAGALRTMIYKREIANPSALEARLERLIGLNDKADSMTFRFAGPVYQIHGDVLYLVRPLEILDIPSATVTLQSESSKGYQSDLSDALSVLTTSDLDAESRESFVPLTTLCEYLRAEIPIPASFCYREDAISSRHRRFAHERADSGVPLDQMLFSRSCLQFTEDRKLERPEQSGYAGFCQDVEECSDVLVRLGGDGRPASLTVRALSMDERASIDKLKSTVLAGTKQGATLLLYLATPAVFKSGWRPPIDEAAHGVRLAAAVVGRPRVFGGWDVAKGRPKPLRRAVPAGSVYFFEVVNESKARFLVETHHFNESICSLSNDSACSLSNDDQIAKVESKLGYGLTFFGIRSQSYRKDRIE